MPSEIISAPCEMVPGTVRNVTHKSFSIFQCICETKRKNESENEKRGNIQECGFRSIIQHKVKERLYEFTKCLCY